MLAAPGLSSYGFTYDNWGANPSATPGTSVTPGASNAEGSWTQVASSANISRDVYWISVRILSGATSAAIKDHLLDIGVDSAGGTSYSAVISNIVCGNSGSATSSGGAAPYGGAQFLFPMFIKAGSAVAARIQGSNGTAGTVRVAIKFYGDPSNPENVPVGQYSETIGTITNSGGVSVTPGNAADGTWALLGTTAKEMWWWQLAVQVSNTAATANRLTYVDLAYGDATNKTIIQRGLFVQSASEEVDDVWNSNLLWLDSYASVPEGADLYIRGRGDGAPNTGWNAVAIGIGG